MNHVRSIGYVFLTTALYCTTVFAMPIPSGENWIASPTLTDLTSQTVQDGNSISIGTPSLYYAISHDPNSGAWIKKFKFEEMIPANQIIFITEWVFVSGESTRAWRESVPAGYEWVPGAPSNGVSTPILNLPADLSKESDLIFPESSLDDGGRTLTMTWPTDPSINGRVVGITKAFKRTVNITSGTVLEITQSPQRLPIPEPSTLVLVLTGAVGFFRRR